MSGFRLALAAFFSALAANGSIAAVADPMATRLVVSVPDQMLALVEGGSASVYRVSTSKFGLGDEWGSYKTPLGHFRICDKLGAKLPLGAVIKHRFPTGEILLPNAPGRDPIVTRILWLEGLEPGNTHARERAIYIHGTTEEERLGQPMSFGCIRMRSLDVARLFEHCGLGNQVTIGNAPLGKLLRQEIGAYLAECPALPGFPARAPVPITQDAAFLTAITYGDAPPWLRLTLGCACPPEPRDTSALRYTALLQYDRQPRLRTGGGSLADSMLAGTPEGSQGGSGPAGL